MKTYVTLSFDDGFRDTLESVTPILDECGLKACFFVITGLVGGTFEGLELSNWEDLKGLAKEGHEIGSHGVTHSPLSRGAESLESMFSKFWSGMLRSSNRSYFLKGISRRLRGIKDKSSPTFNVREELVNSKTRIESEIPYQKCLSLAYPGGVYSEKAMALVREAGYLSARSMNIGFNNPKSLKRFRLNVYVWRSSMKTEDMNKVVMEALRKGTWLIECFHSVGKYTSKGSDYFINLPDFRNHLEFLSGLSDTIIVDTQQAIIKLLESE